METSLKNKDWTYLVDVLRRRWVVIVTLCGIGIILMPVVKKLTPPVFRATAELLIVSQTSKDTTESNPDLPTIVASTAVLDRVIKRLELRTNPLALGKKIKTKSPAKASTLELTYEDGDGPRSAAVANAIADESSAYFHQVATSGYNDAIAALTVRIAQSRAQIAADDRLLQSRHAFAASDRVLDDLTSQIDELRVEHRQLSATLAADSALVSAFDRQLAEIKPIVRGEILQKQVVYQQLQGELARDVGDLDSERASFRESFPGLKALQKRVSRERTSLSSAAASAVKDGAGLSASYTQSLLDRARAAGALAADRERLLANNEQLVAEQRHLTQVAGAGAALGTLRAERSAALDRYLALTQRLGTTQADAAQAASLGNLVVVSRAVPGPAERDWWPLVIGGLVCVLAFGAAFAVDALDRRFWGTREMEDAYGRPVLMEIRSDR